MGESFMTSLTMENHYPSTFLSMDPTRISTTALAISLEDSERELVIQPRHNMSLSLPAPDINLPIPADRFTPPPIWGSDSCEVLDVGLGPHVNETEATIHHLPKVCSRKCSKRADSIWGGWFFFNSYFKPILSEKSKTKIAPEGTQVSGFDKSDLKLDVFLVQHDMENMYMWVFKENPRMLSKDAAAQLHERPLPAWRTPVPLQCR
ncbi:hypothetical protein HPP92_006342 [Vanilla planifolia]|uniref:DUF8041 domain-containing protein n=1 Tax=Vanilla planifolia TaxID=51239 RepID=A0A835RI83_VANPL|nr:hypothetical protein HPP92_006342 [Vanilla planifolia]